MATWDDAEKEAERLAWIADREATFLDQRGRWDHLKVPNSPHQAKARESVADLRPRAKANRKRGEESEADGTQT